MNTLIINEYQQTVLAKHANTWQDILQIESFHDLSEQHKSAFYLGQLKQISDATILNHEFIQVQVQS